MGRVYIYRRGGGGGGRGLSPVKHSAIIKAIPDASAIREVDW